MSSAPASIRVSTATGQVVSPGSTLAVPGASQAFVAQDLDQFGNVLATQPTFTWSATTIPPVRRGQVLTAKGAAATVTFAKAGTYGIAVQAKAARRFGCGQCVDKRHARWQVASRTSRPRRPMFRGRACNWPFQPSSISSATSLAVPPALTWSTTSPPPVRSAPSFTTSGGVTTVTFAMAGSYSLTARVASAPEPFVRHHGDGESNVDEHCRFAQPGHRPPGSHCSNSLPQALDQFRQAMANQQTFTWSASAGTISASGLFTAPEQRQQLHGNRQEWHGVGHGDGHHPGQLGELARRRPWRSSSKALTPTVRSVGTT